TVRRSMVGEDPGPSRLRAAIVVRRAPGCTTRAAACAAAAVVRGQPEVETTLTRALRKRYTKAAHSPTTSAPRREREETTGHAARQRERPARRAHPVRTGITYDQRLGTSARSARAA